MKQANTCKLIAIVAYLFIMLMGQMIAVPFCLWLMGTLFDFGNADQVFAWLAVVGLVISVTTLFKPKTPVIILIDAVCFLLLASPLISRMTSVPIHLFNYPSFIIPAIIFVLFYLLSIAFSIQQYFHSRKANPLNPKF